MLGDNRAIFSPPDRRRRRIPWWLIPVGVVVGLSVLAGTLRSETREVVAYLDAARDVMVDQAAAATSFEELVRVEFSSIERADFETYFQQTQANLSDARSALEEIEVPDSAAIIDELLRLALDAWERGLDTFAAGVLEAADEPDSPGAVQTIEEGVLLLRLGDEMYSRFLDRSVPVIESVDVVIGQFPEVSFAAGEATLASASNIAGFVRTSSQLGVRSDIAIVSVVFDPPRGDAETDSGAIIFPATEILLLQASVRNVGNQPEQGIVVELEMFDSTGAPVESLDSDQIDLAAGEATSISFGPIAVIAGESYNLLLSVPRTETEVVIDNNRWERQLIVTSP
jgi:hypothetical protein